MSNSRYLLPVADTLSAAWNKVNGSKLTFWGALLSLFVITFVITFATNMATDAFHIFGRFLGFIGSLLTTLISVGLLYMGIRRASDADIKVNNLYHALNFDMGISVIGVFIIQLLLTLLIGFVFFILPTFSFLSSLSSVMYAICVILVIVLSIRISLALGYVLDKDLDAIDAVKKSFAATKHNFWRIFFTNLIMMIIVVVSAIPLGIGLIWTLPFMYIVYGMIYKQLSSASS